MSENTMVASNSSRSDSADGEASTSSATSGGRKDASALLGEQGPLLHALEPEAEPGLGGRVADQLLTGHRQRLGRGDRHRQRAEQLLLVPDRKRPAPRLRHGQGLLHAVALERDGLGQRAPEGQHRQAQGRPAAGRQVPQTTPINFEQKAIYQALSIQPPARITTFDPT
jgi:hypothetical protein